MIAQKVYEEYLSDLLAGKRSCCARVVQDLLDAGVQIREMYTDLFHRSMYEIGALWESNKISVATEHLATAVTESLLALVYPKLFAAERTGRTAVIACTANEYHQIGGKMVADMFELHGWDGYFLGANTPLSDLLSIIAEKNPELVGLSLSAAVNLPRLEEAINAVQQRYPRTTLLVGGHALRKHGRQISDRYSGVTYLDSLAALEDFIVLRGKPDVILPR